MRIIVYGVGAIGGTLAVALAEAGNDVIGIARGAQLEAIRSKGLRLITPHGERLQEFACVENPSEIAPEPSDIVVLTMKTQDTWDALQDLRTAGFDGQPIFCVQNGLANDDMALRLFPNVFGVVINMPATYTEPGTVLNFYATKLGLLEIGRHGAGDNDAAWAFAERLNDAGFAANVHDDLKPWRYAKLLSNLGNAVDAAMGKSTDAKAFIEAARAEGQAVFEAAGIELADLQSGGRSEASRMGKIEGYDRVGSSSTQSLARGVGSIETDYLNGEVVLLGRKLNVPTPVNAWFARRAQLMVERGESAGSITGAEVIQNLGQP